MRLSTLWLVMALLLTVMHVVVLALGGTTNSQAALICLSTAVILIQLEKNDEQP